MTSLWKVGIRPQSERNIQLEYRCFKCRNVSLKIYVNKDGSLGQSLRRKKSGIVTGHYNR